MAVAGKVAITLSTENGGAWSSDVTYDRLVAVKHNNNLYISRKTVANVEPPNNEFWFLALEGFSGDDIEDIINGTTQVGNAKTLDGVPLSHNGANGVVHILSDTGVMEVGSIIDFHTTDGQDFKVRVSVEEGTGRLVFINDRGVSEYLTIGSEIRPIKIKDTINTLFTPTEEGTWFVANSADGTFPYSYGLLEIRYGSYNEEFTATFKSTGTDNRLYYNTFVDVNGVGTWSGWKNLPTMFDLANYIAKADKPTGTYTGNGSSAARTIQTGGIGLTLMIYASHFSYVAFVTPQGAILATNNSVTYANIENVSFAKGVLTLATTNEILNKSGADYWYQVL